MLAYPRPASETAQPQPARKRPVVPKLDLSKLPRASEPWVIKASPTSPASSRSSTERSSSTLSSASVSSLVRQQAPSSSSSSSQPLTDSSSSANSVNAPKTCACSYELAVGPQDAALLAQLEATLKQASQLGLACCKPKQPRLRTASAVSLATKTQSAPSSSVDSSSSSTTAAALAEPSWQLDGWDKIDARELVIASQPVGKGGNGVVHQVCCCYRSVICSWLLAQEC